MMSMAAALVVLAITIVAVGASRTGGTTEAGVMLRSEVAFAPSTVPATIAAPEVTAPSSPDPLSEADPDGAGIAGAVDWEPRPSTGRLRFVYFIEAGEDFDPESVGRIERQAAALQQFWFDQFGGTFHLPETGVDVVYGEHPVEWYDTTVNGEDERWYRLLNMEQEVHRSLALDPADDVRMVVYPSARLDGRVGANRYGSAWMDGDDLTCIDGDIATIPYSAQFPANCLTTVAHELGHVYGLGHEGEDADCMQLGFYQYVTGDELCSFSEAGRQLVRADPRNTGWLDAEPGDSR